MSDCARLCLHNIACSFSPMTFKFSDMAIMDKTLNWLTFRDCGSIFKVTGGHASKLTLFTQYFLQFFTNGFQILRCDDHEQGLELLNSSWLWRNFQGRRGYYVSKLTLFTQYFLQFFTSGFQILTYGDYGQDLELINFSWLWHNFQGHRGSLCFKINFVMQYFL